MNHVIFCIKEIEGSDRYMVCYPDGTSDAMTKAEIKESFNVPLSGGGGVFNNECDAAIFAIEQENAPHDDSANFLDDDFEDFQIMEEDSKPSSKKRVFTVKDSDLV